MNQRELATVLAALRYWQATLANGDANRIGKEIFDIATDGGVEPMDAEEIDELCEHLNTTFFIEEEQPQQEPDEPAAWHRYELITGPDGSLGGLASTNDNEDKGHPSSYAEWHVNYPDRAAAMLHTGGSHIGISGVKVTVTIDGEQV